MKVIALSFSGFIFLLPSVSTGKCLSRSKEQTFQVIPIFVKGKVKDLNTRAIPDKSGSEDISFKVEVISVLKGDVAKDKLEVSYKWSNSKEPIRRFNSDQIYIFPIETLKGDKAVVSTSTCVPDFTEDELRKLNVVHLIPNKETAVKLAEVYLVSIYGEKVRQQRPFQAMREDDMWVLKGTFHCPKGQNCLGGVAEIKIRASNGEVLSYSHGK